MEVTTRLNQEEKEEKHFNRIVRDFRKEAGL